MKTETKEDCDSFKIQKYMEMAESIAKLSPDIDTKVGAVLLSSTNRIVASSFNGFLRGAPDHKMPLTRPEKYTYLQHAERNLIYNCAYEGIRTKDTTIICTLSPCVDCLRASFASGVKTIIFKDLYRIFKNSDIYTELPDVKVEVSKIGTFTKLQMSRIDEKDS